jgi:hypothetical protein
MDEKQDYQIVITASAERAYFEVLEYVYRHHSIIRADEIALQLIEYPQILKQFPNLGTTEPNLKHRSKDYKFILYKRTTKSTVKIIYYISDWNRTIYLVDFFPCEMFEQKIKRSQ